MRLWIVSLIFKINLDLKFYVLKHGMFFVMIFLKNIIIIIIILSSMDCVKHCFLKIKAKNSELQISVFFPIILNIYIYISVIVTYCIKIDFLLFDEQPDIKGPLSRLAYPVDQIDKIGFCFQ